MKLLIHQLEKYFFLILIISSLVNCKHNTHDNEIAKTDKIQFGKVDSLYSEILKESRKVWVYIPENFDVLDENKVYPVLYLLDGDAHYFSVSGMVKQLSAVNGNTILPEMIIVAIPNTNRDLTPTHVDINFFTGDSISYDTGGGDRFLDFLEKELVPYIEKQYPASSHRTYVGHSLGGISVINALIKKPYLFNNYIAIDPSLWWDNMAFRDYADSILTTDNFKDKALYVAIANTMEVGMDIQNVEKDTSVNTAHIRSILQFVKSIEKSNTNGLDFKWKYYNDDDHGSVPLISEYDGLRYLFQWHNFKGWNQIISSVSEKTAEELVRLPKEHFDDVSKHLGFEVLPPEELIREIGYYLLGEKMPEKASVFFDLNIKNYPNSSDVYDSRGDCYLAEKDSLNALEFFNKALKLEDLEIYRTKIEKLEESLKK